MNLFILFLFFQTFILQASAPSAIEEKKPHEHIIEIKQFVDLFTAEQMPELRSVLNNPASANLPKELNEIIIQYSAFNPTEETFIAEKISHEQRRYSEAARNSLTRVQSYCYRGCIDNPRDKRCKAMLGLTGLIFVGSVAYVIYTVFSPP